MERPRVDQGSADASLLPADGTAGPDLQPPARDPNQYAPPEVEAIARLCLADLPVRIAPGDWWGYSLDAGLVTYPPLFLEVWPGPRIIGALLHEVAEALFSGPEAAGVFAGFGRHAAALGCAEPTAVLLLNAVNDLRVNRLYASRCPGSRRFFAAVYAAGEPLERQDDVPHEGRPIGGLPHHQFVSGIARRWARSVWPDAAQPLALPATVERALRRTWPAILRAVEADDLAECAAIVAAEVLPAYAELVAASLQILAHPELAERDRSLEGVPPEEPPEDALAGGGEAAGGIYAIAEGTVLAGEGTEEAAAALQRSEVAAGRPPARRASRAEFWPPAVIYRVRQFRREGPDYEAFDYVGAVRRLEPQIRVALDGRDGQLGLAEILTLRRFGTTDPWRRPRRRLRGDSGEIDGDHPENLLVEPSIAFLKRAQKHREDSQKDFADVILLDVSGSVVQRGYPSRKFEQLVDTLVVFCELHERLKLPYELIAFSDSPTVLRAFAEVTYVHQHVDPASAYVIKDFSYLVRDLYRLEHGETQEAVALRLALTEANRQRGLKTLLVVTDGISSDRPALTRLLLEVEERNAGLPVGERVKVLAFEVGRAEEEFKASYEPEVEGRPLRCSSACLVPDVEALPAVVCRAVEQRIRQA